MPCSDRLKTVKNLPRVELSFANRIGQISTGILVTAPSKYPFPFIVTVKGIRTTDLFSQVPPVVTSKSQVALDRRNTHTHAEGAVIEEGELEIHTEMGKYMRKCKRIGEIGVMELAEVGVITRARKLAMATRAAKAAANAGALKRRKVGSGELQFCSSYLQLRTRRLPVITPDKLVSAATSENPGQVITEERCSSPISDHVQASQCSSNGSTELVEESARSVDLEGEGDCSHIDYSMTYSVSDCIRRREKTPSSELRAESGDLESTARPAEANSRHRSTADKMPTETEIEDFFSAFYAAEKEEQKRFADKYNFDILKDVPLEGRYEWVRIKP